MTNISCKIINKPMPSLRVLPIILGYLFVFHLMEYVPTAFTKICRLTHNCTPKFCGLPPGRHSLNDIKIGPDISEELVKKYCEEFIDEESLICCYTSQFHLLLEQTRLLEGNKLLAGCPACLSNFRRHICNMICSPYQATFIVVNKRDENAIVAGKDNASIAPVESVFFYISPSYLENVFSSCSQVRTPSNERAVDLMCGHWGKQCNALRWFSYMGNKTENPKLPFDVQYLKRDFTNSTFFVSFNPKVFRCNQSFETIPGKWYVPCACQDCASSCRLSVRQPFLINGVDGYGLIMAAVFLILATVFFTVVCLRRENLNAYVNRKLAERVKFGLRKNQLSYIERRHNEWLRNDSRLAALRIANSKELEANQQCCKKLRACLVIVTLVLKKLGVLLKPLKFLLRKIGDLFYYLRVHAQNNWENFYLWLGYNMTKYPLFVITVGVVAIAQFGVGVLHVKWAKEPAELWASPNSRAGQEKQFFESHFEPLHRTETIIISSKGLPEIWIIDEGLYNDTIGPVFNKTFLLKVLDLQKQITELVVDNTSITDVCVAPYATTGTKVTQDMCVIQSVWSWFQNDESKVANVETDVYMNRIHKCIRKPHEYVCLGTFGGAVLPALVLGGYYPSRTTRFHAATALIINIHLIDNRRNIKKQNRIREWEKTYLEFMKNYTKNEMPEYMEIAYTSESEYENYIVDEFDMDETMLLTFLVMLICICVLLGRKSTFLMILLESKVTLGICGVLIILSSVACSVGIISYIGITTSPVIVKAVLLLMMAIGTDNIFILVQFNQWQEWEPRETVAEHIARTMHEVGPSMFLVSAAESACFLVGAVSDMLAVRAFALTAGIALLVNFVLQVTCFLAFMAFDALRQQSGRIDICCCAQTTPDYTENSDRKGGFIYNLVKDVYAPFLMHVYVRGAVVVLCIAWFCISLSVAPHIEVGFEREVFLRDDSLQRKYLKHYNKYMDIGPPVYFVVDGVGFDYSEHNIANLICGNILCNDDSLVNQINRAARHATFTHIGQTAQSWIDDYYLWSTIPGCCTHADGDPNTFCLHKKPECQKNRCTIYFTDLRIRKDHFVFYIPWFLKDMPDAQCSTTGGIKYKHAVTLKEISTNQYDVIAAHYKSYHTALNNTDDHLRALQSARKIADKIETFINNKLYHLNVSARVRVFPYSKFYVYYEQFLNIWIAVCKHVGLCLLGVFLALALITGCDLISALLVVVTIAMVVVDLLGIIYLWGITMNYLVIINLMTAVGVTVTFCVPQVHRFIVLEGSSYVLRAWFALAFVASSVLNTTISKLAGLIVLSTSDNPIFKMYCFPIQLGMVLFGVLHGLVFLPALLTYFGVGPLKKQLPSEQPSSEEVDSKPAPHIRIEEPEYTVRTKSENYRSPTRKLSLAHSM